MKEVMDNVAMVGGFLGVTCLVIAALLWGTDKHRYTRWSLIVFGVGSAVSGQLFRLSSNDGQWWWIILAFVLLALSAVVAKFINLLGDQVMDSVARGSNE